MMTPARIVRMIGIAGLVGWMGLAGWVAKTTQAQNGGQNPAPLPPTATMPENLPMEGQETPKVQRNDAPAPLPVAADSAASSASDPPPPLPPVGKHHAAKEESLSTAAPRGIPAPTQQASAASEPAGIRTLTESQTAPSGDDPEQSAQSFVERNQKEAEDHLRVSDCRGPAASGPPGQAGIGHQEVAGSGGRLEVLPGATGHLDHKRAQGRGCGRSGANQAEPGWRGPCRQACQVGDRHVGSHWCECPAGPKR